MKPDQLIKRRGKLGLIKVNTDFETVKSWVAEKMAADQQVSINFINIKDIGFCSFKKSRLLIFVCDTFCYI